MTLCNQWAETPSNLFCCCWWRRLLFRFSWNFSLVESALGRLGNTTLPSSTSPYIDGGMVSWGGGWMVVIRNKHQVVDFDAIHIRTARIPNDLNSVCRLRLAAHTIPTENTTLVRLLFDCDTKACHDRVYELYYCERRNLRIAIFDFYGRFVPISFCMRSPANHCHCRHQ